MSRWVQFCKWCIVIGLIVLVLTGLYAWQVGSQPAEVIIVTPTTWVYSATETATVSPSPSLTPRPEDTATPMPTWTTTSTPSRTPAPSQTPTITPSPAPISRIAPTPMLTDTTVVTSTLPQPTPMPLVRQPEGTVNILLLGSDLEPDGKVGRTDVIMIASIFPDVPSVSLISVPRDYYAWIPTWGLDKINTAYLRANKTRYPGGGPDLIKATIEYNFGISIHYYAMVNFSSYRRIVDAVGGVDLVVECPLHDTYPDSESESGQTDIDLEPGVHHLDGKFALWYVRSRWSTSDFDRHRRQQQVLRSILQKALSQNMLLHIHDLWGVYKDEVQTDMALPELLYLAPIATRLNEQDIKSRFVRGSTLLESWTAPNGGYVLVPHYDALYEFIQEAAQPPVSSRAAQRAYRVEIWNGTGNQGWGHVAAYRLGLQGFVVTDIQPIEGTPTTTLVDFTTTSKGSPLYKLLRLYKRNQGDVVAQPAEGHPVDFRVVLGWDYDPCVGTITARWRPTPTPAPTVTPTPNP